jgi:hypothetical protein
VLLHSHGGTLFIDIGEQSKRIDDELVAKGMWKVWLGPDGVSPSLKESLARQVATGGC